MNKQWTTLEVRAISAAKTDVIADADADAELSNKDYCAVLAWKFQIFFITLTQGGISNIQHGPYDKVAYRTG